MCKFTTIILLCCTILLLSTNLDAQNADFELLRKINTSSTRELREYSAFISNTTKITAISVPVVMGAVALLEKNDDLLKNALYVGVSMGVTTVFTYSLKYTVNRTRPYENVDYGSMLNVSPDFYESSASFPSGHTSLAFGTATALSLKYPKWYVIVPGYAWACSVGYSRMNLGVHYPTDVVAGALLGAGSAYITYKINNWFWKKQDNKKLIGLEGYM